MWRFSSVYRFSEDSQKWRTWRLLEGLAVNYSIPWLHVGDLNKILFDHEKSGGNLRRVDRMSDSRHCLEDCGLSDLGFVGHT